MKVLIFKNKFFLLWIPVITYAGFIFYLSSRPQLQLPVSFLFLDKLLHILEYSILGFLLIRAMRRTYQSAEMKKLYLLVALMAFVYGVSDEFHQVFVPGRNVSFWDALADTLGGFLGALFYR